jgi:hypothetical protein
MECASGLAVRASCRPLRIAWGPHAHLNIFSRGDVMSLQYTIRENDHGRKSECRSAD